MIVITAIAALVAYLVVRITGRRTPHPSVVAPAGGPPFEDAALQQLRLRYARGEVNRTDYLQAAADLGAPPNETAAEPRAPM